MTRRMLVGGALISALYLFSSSAPAADDPAIPKAIDNGVAALKRMYNGGGGDGVGKVGRRGGHAGVPALMGLTLLECGVSADDPVVKQIAADLRQECIELDHTYSLALSIMFFDKLDNPNDLALIQSMGVRLLGGQSPDSGGWSYTCPVPRPEEVRRLNEVQTAKKDAQIEKKALPTKEIVKPEESMWKQPPPLEKGLKDDVDRIQNNKPANAPAKAPANVKKDPEPVRGFLGVGDNSNTQFAILGLWVAGRHGVPIEKAMAKVDARFRNSQHLDGGWNYHSAMGNRGGASTAAMTCAGLLGLAMSHGAANQAVLRTDPKTPTNKLPRDPARDPAVRAGLMALGTSLGQPVDVRNKGRMGRALIMKKGYYFLWSVERVAVAYNLTTIGNKDWYAWGSQILVASQGPDGSWDGEHGPEVDTCFALLFLRRVNLARDLTASLRGVVKDPGEVKLTAGGVGGDELLAKGLISGLVFQDSEDKPATSESAKLTDDLIRAPAAKQEPMIVKLKDGKGYVYTDALAAAIPQLTGSTKIRARDALAERLARMTADTLRDKLQDDEAEVRRAAVVACYMKEAKALTPELIDSLDDKDAMVARAAQAALREMTRLDFGPAAGATADERDKAIAAWRAWWKKQSK